MDVLRLHRHGAEPGQPGNPVFVNPARVMFFQDAWVGGTDIYFDMETDAMHVVEDCAEVAALMGTVRRLGDAEAADQP